MNYRLYKVMILLVTCSCIAAARSNRSSLHIVVVLSSSESLEKSSNRSALSYWNQAKQLLPAIELAANKVNNDSSILKDYVIELIPISVPDTDPNHGVVEFVKEIVSKRRNIVGVVGVFDDRLGEVILPLAGHTGIDLIQLVDPTALHLDNSGQYHHAFTMYPSLAMHVRAATFIFQKLNWIRVGLVYSSTHYGSLYLRAADTFLAFIKLIDIHINIVLIDVGYNVSTDSTLERIQRSGVLAFLTLLPHQASAELICRAQQKSLEYAWILLDNGVLNETALNTPYRCTIPNPPETVENTFLIRQTAQLPNYNELPARNMRTGDSTESDVPVTENPYSHVLHDFVWAFCLALNNSLETLEERNMSLQNYGRGMSEITKVVEGELINLTFPSMARQISIGRYPPEDNQILDILQLQSDRFQKIGSFDTRTKNLTFNVTVTIPGLGPSITYSYDTFPTAMTVFLSALTGGCFLFTTVVLIVFIAFRNEQEVKATSAWLSLCMFLGCYLILGGALTHFLANGFPLKTESERISTCIIDTFCISIGIDLVFTTLLAKLLRIWRIFTLHGRTGRGWTDQSLLLFIGLVTLVKFVMLLIWTIADVYRLEDYVTVISTGNNNYNYQIVQQCASQYYSLWLVLIYGYSAVIALILIAVAIITRKIKQENFKDTKKVSILMSTILFMAVVSGSVWAVLRLSDDSIASKVIIGLAYCLIAMLCEVFLFLPKILPPLLRQFKSAVVVHKPQGTSTGPSVSTQKSSLHSVN